MALDYKIDSFNVTNTTIKPSPNSSYFRLKGDTVNSSERDCGGGDPNNTTQEYIISTEIANKGIQNYND